MALAHEAARRGARLALTARNSERLVALASAIRTAGGTAEAFPADVRDRAAVRDAAAAAEKSLGPVDIVIANAGTHVFTKPEQFDSCEYLELMNVNFGGMLHTIEAVLPVMMERGRGRVVGMASLAGFRGLPRAAAYGASKAAMIHFLESIRFHLRPHGIAVTVVNPGFVRTPLTDKNDFYMPFLTEPNRAAAIICRGLERGRDEIAFPAPFSWFVKLLRITPYPLYDRFIDWLWEKQKACASR